ncbi:hypothetical protein PAXINDRAFT_100368 [Paxillus involutus ATCC 200175]|uniref:Unplaced genomic scaffold PAXINscaffold_24, whole genome shotgun sequence n=1 Tax=Paxillus involutus ATCC 200175 TaxID=664439 RepID=A0A0C9U3C0_PAXIN|nr:hypothetical protein PAXINDRAFT_100368 [Paxillus involutus ATCC 200175]
MLPLLLVFSLLVQLAGAAPTNAASESPAPAPDPASCNYRSVWSILGTCALTLIICIWKTSFPNIMHEPSRYKVVLYRVGLGLVALVSPEITTVRAYTEWRLAGKIQEEFSDRGWTRTHGFFALMGGFLLQDGTRQELLKDTDGLARPRGEVIVNSKITKEEIRDRSKSDGIGNAVLVLQLSWFILQVIARAANDLAITLVEIDTLALAVLSLPLFFFWWSKPMAVEHPHIFYIYKQRSTDSSADDDDGTQKASFNSEQDYTFSISRGRRYWLGEIIGVREVDQNSFSVLLIVWIIFGSLHLIAWDFQFPSQVEKIMWRAASLTLIGAPCFYLLVIVVGKKRLYALAEPQLPGMILPILIFGPILLGVVARVVLLVLMFASLRDLPPSAHDTVPWTVYVPHL